MDRKKGLGRGLGALIPPLAEEKVDNVKKEPAETGKISTKKPRTVEKAVEKDGPVTELAVSKIEPRKNQPRKTFDEEALNELADSIRKNGVLQPILVCPAGDHYEIIAGERRWRAAKLAGLKKIPVLVRENETQSVTELALIENIQREDLNPIEEALAYRRLLEEYGLKQEELADKVSKSRTAVSNRLRLLKLSGNVQDLVVEGALTEGHARALLALEDAGMQEEAARLVIDGDLSVRETERLVKRLLHPQAPRGSEGWRTADKVIYDELEQRLRKNLGAKVTIKRRKEDQGQILIDYYSIDELEQLMSLLGGR